jgi:flavodoxin
MKKMLLSFWVLLFVLALVGCSNNASSETHKNTASTSTPVTGTPAASAPTVTENKGDGSKILIVYFGRVGNTVFPDDVDAISSASLLEKDGVLVGNTQYIANLIQQNMGGDMFLIETSEKYPTDFEKTVAQGKSENEKKARPALAFHVENLDNYNVIFLGFPNWWYDMPMAVYSFLDK